MYEMRCDVRTINLTMICEQKVCEDERDATDASTATTSGRGERVGIMR